MNELLKYFDQTGMNDLPVVGGKNASLGEMFRNLSVKGIMVPDGFAITSEGYYLFLTENNLSLKLEKILSSLDTDNFSNLSKTGAACRELFMNAKLPEKIKNALKEGYDFLVKKYGKEISLAARSSATAEDLPDASFAGQQETFLNIKTPDQLYKSCHRCLASLFTNRAIKYRTDHGYEHMKVAISVGVQLMVRSDKSCSGVLFTLDPDSGFENITLISGAWGLGENVVQGSVNTDEFLVYSPFIGKTDQPVISRKKGTKEKMMIFNDKQEEIQKPEDAIINIITPESLRKKFILNDKEIIQLAGWAQEIREYYGRHMDIEWAKDGISNKLFILQARPETVHSQIKSKNIYTEFYIQKKGKVLCKGIGLGNRIVSGKARVLHSPSDIDKLNKGEILVTEKTNPDWDPILKKAAAIITNQGGRTSHAAIVARELGAMAVIGTTDGTQKIPDGEIISVSTAEGETGFVYEGQAEWEEKEFDFSGLELPQTDPMFILAHPEVAFKYAALPNRGVGLLRMEFIVSSHIRIHPMALFHFEKLKDTNAKSLIEELTEGYENKKEYFITKLAEGVSVIAAAFFPKDVIVRMSDFKTNEYSELIGGKEFEPEEENPMIGFRGASRYYHPLYKDGFELECKAIKFVREEMGFTNVKVMIPFCRTVSEAKKVNSILADQGLKKGENGLEIYMMVEIPSNALLAEKFAEHYDGFSIGSNDLTQLTLGADRDSGFLKDTFSPFDEAVMQLIETAIRKAKEKGIKIGLCGQAPSDYPEYAKFLVNCGIDSISFNPDALFKGIENIKEAERINKNKNGKNLY